MSFWLTPESEIIGLATATAAAMFLECVNSLEVKRISVIALGVGRNRHAVPIPWLWRLRTPASESGAFESGRTRLQSTAGMSTIANTYHRGLTCHLKIWRNSADIPARPSARSVSARAIRPGENVPSRINPPTSVASAGSTGAPRCEIAAAPVQQIHATTKVREKNFSSGRVTRCDRPIIDPRSLLPPLSLPLEDLRRKGSAEQEHQCERCYVNRVHRPAVPLPDSAKK
jgi:hypothetical protein